MNRSTAASTSSMATTSMLVTLAQPAIEAG